MNQTSPSEGVRKPVLLLIVAVTVLAVGAVIIMRSKRSAPADETPAASAADSASAEAPAFQRPKPVHAIAVSQGENPPADSPAAPPAQPVALTGLPGNPQPTAETRNIIASLANMNLKEKPLTPADAAAYLESLNWLSKSGPAGVAAIQEYLALNKDLSFESTTGAAELMGSPTLRLALLETLSQMGGPEALALASGSLRNSTDPREIAALAQMLEKQEPGQHREAALAAARAALGEAAAGRLEGKDVGPLFDLLKNYGGVNAIADLQQAAGGQWKYYATIALRDLPDGAGLPVLADLVSNPKNAGASVRAAALPVLAEMAEGNPEANRVLTEQARGCAIPDAVWINVAAALAGDRFAIGNRSAASNPNLRTWHLAYGNQNYYASPSALSGEQIRARQALLAQYLQVVQSAGCSPFVVATLQNAQNTLASRTPPPGQ